MNLKSVLLFTFVALPLSARANVCGTDYQGFNPTTNGLAFVTVQSSETLKPCFVNLGVFTNYAANSLTFSRTVSPGIQSGDQQSDRILGMDLSIGTGITKRWDFGINVPMVIGDSAGSSDYLSTFGKKGLTEIKANTKYRLLGDETKGIAGIFSINKNLIENNPLAGTNSGPTFNFEVAADTTFEKKWAAAINFGYRKRNPGDPIPNLPFVPMKDQWIYSIAGSYLVASLDTKIIAEIYGSRAAQPVDAGTDRPLNTLEGLLGVKHDATQDLAMHLGAAHKLDSALGGSEWRLYAGLNWNFGPVCKTAVAERVEPGEITQAAHEKPTEVVNLDVKLLFKTNSDQVDPEKLAEVDESIKTLFDTPLKKVSVVGHTDSVGRAAYNMKLSQRRADFVAKHLISKFKIDPKKVEAIGRGDTEPIADNGNYQGRQKNRRVEIKVWR